MEHPIAKKVREGKGLVKYDEDRNSLDDFLDRTCSPSAIARRHSDTIGQFCSIMDEISGTDVRNVSMPKGYKFESEEQKMWGCRHIFYSFFLNCEDRFIYSTDFYRLVRKYRMDNAETYVKYRDKFCEIDLFQRENDPICAFDSNYRPYKWTMVSSFVWCIYNAAIDGDEYSKIFLKNIFAQYYSKEYIALKKFRAITEREIYSFGNEGEEYGTLEYYSTIAIVMAMLPILDISDDDDDFCYYFINRIVSDIKEIIDKKEEKRDEQLKQYEEMRISWDELDEKTHRIMSQLPSSYSRKEHINTKTDKMAWDMVSRTFYDLDMDKDEMLKLQPMDVSDYRAFRGILSELLYFMSEEEIMKLSKKEIANYKLIYILCMSVHYIYSEYRILHQLIMETDDESVDVQNFEKKFNREWSNETEESAKNDDTDTADIEDDVEDDINNQTQEELKDTISALKEEITRLKNEKKNLSYAYNELKSENRQLQKELEQSNRRMEENKNPFVEPSNSKETQEILSMQEMISEIYNKKVIIVGGNDNFNNKLHNMLPNFKIIYADDYSTIDTSIIFNCDKLYFQSEHMCHGAYKRFINRLRDNKIEYGYISKTNLESLVKQIYNDLCIIKPE